MAKRKRYTSEQIITKLREGEVLLSQGKTVREMCRTLEISEQTYYRWRREYGGLNTTQAKKLKELEKENVSLKKLVRIYRWIMPSSRKCCQKNNQPGQASSSCRTSAASLERVRKTRLPGNWTTPVNATL